MISIIFPTYNEEGNLDALFQKLTEVTNRISGEPFEFIFVDDCSNDQTPDILQRLQAKDGRVKVIRFARNCGSHAAVAAGLHHCRGLCAIILAADLQDPPEIIVKMIEEWKKGAKIVWGTRLKRKGESAQTQFLSRLYYQLVNWLTTVKMPPVGTDVFLADRDVINAFKGVAEKHTSIFMTLAWLGFPQKSVDYIKEARFKGKTKWTLARKIKLTLDSILAFSDLPIRYMSVVGFITAFIGFLYALFILWKNIFLGNPVQGWSSLMVALLVVGGIQMMMLGILGEYLWRTFDESRRRPRYVIEYKRGLD